MGSCLNFKMQHAVKRLTMDRHGLTRLFPYSKNGINRDETSSNIRTDDNMKDECSFFGDWLDDKEDLPTPSRKTEEPVNHKYPGMNLSRRLSVASLFAKHLDSTAENEKARNSVIRESKKTDAGTKYEQNTWIKSGACAGFSFGSLSRIGYFPSNSAKRNQDSMISLENCGQNIPLFGVLDGHGINGGHVSVFMAIAIIDCAEKYIWKEPEGQVNGSDMLKTVISHAVVMLTANSGIDLSFSGTTLTLSTIVDNILYTANIGDSRLVAVKIADSIVVAEALSRDHKPGISTEMIRIENRGGRVAPLPGPVGVDTGPMRVWLMDLDIPGISMSRSIGDTIAQRVGVVDIPEITEYAITENVLMFLWATDGIWEFLSNLEAAKICIKTMEELLLKDCHGEHGFFPTEKLPIGSVAEGLIRESTNRWVLEEDAIDDCSTVILVVKPFDFTNAVIT